MEVHVKKLHQEHDDIMTRFEDSQINLQDDGPEAETVFKTDMELIRGFYDCRSAPSPSLPK
jgi:hypothetical protein